MVNAYQSEAVSSVPSPDAAGLSIRGLERIWAEVDGDSDVQQARSEYLRACREVDRLLTEEV